jgi:hypothetical protein
MTTDHLTTATAIELKDHLVALQRERAAATLEGLADNDLYMGALGNELEATRAAYVLAAVTEIASLRAALDGPQLG